MRSHAEAPSAGSVWIAAAAFAIALLAFSLTASTASAAISYVGTEPASEVDKDSAALNGYFGNDGQEAHYFFEWGETEAYGHKTPLPPGDAVPGAEFQPVPPIAISGLAAGTTYHYRLVVSDPDGSESSGDATFTTAPPVDNLSADPASAITDVSADLNASFDGDGAHETHYFFEWGPSTAYGNTTPLPSGNSVPAETGRIVVPPVMISGLERGATYHYRVVASNALGTTASADMQFKTAEAPLVSNVSTRNVTATSAELIGAVNPRLGQTSFYFEWGPTAAYGNSIPVPSGDIGGGNSPAPVSAQLEGLTPGVTYHFRLVATNQYGTTVSPDQAFGFYPPNCPNSQVRQETRSNDLPDCRAYELVTPSFAQGAVVMPGSGPTSGGLAANPPRIAYGANFGLFPESTGEGMNSVNDLYVSTRTDTGWSQRYVGLPATHGIFMGGPIGAYLPSPTLSIAPGLAQRGTQASPNLDRVVNYNWGFPGNTELRSPGSNGPYVWNTSTGNLLERWPTNLAAVGGEHFVGFPQASADLSHFVFSSNVIFAPGGEASPGELECCERTPTSDEVWPEASVYDNDVKAGGVVLASREADGTPFKGRAFDISEDGTHILMAKGADLRTGVPADPIEPEEVVLGAEAPGPFYLRVDGARTYEIAPGHSLQYAGSTADGATVYLTSKDQLTPDDHDSSRDLFAWHESEPNSLTRISTGNHGNSGNTDECAALEGWTTACDVSIVEMAAPRAADGSGGNGHTDNYLSSKSGDVYFESPEQLVGNRGIEGARNLYLYRAGTLRYVTTMSPSLRVSRMQVTADGKHMALTTGSNLTEYDSAGHLEMYLYDPEGGRIICASCRPDGQQPVSDVFASQNGLFLANDGRAFFSTKDPLVPRDTNAVEDIYEFTEGKAQLITSGIGAGLETYIGGQATPGLVSVSAGGTDVYFATIDKLVTQDHNGAQIKIYDARTGGGFPAEREEPKCTAADECHGQSSSAPALPADRTSAGLGTPQKAKAHKAKKHKKAHKHRKHRKKHAGKAKAKRQAGSGKQGGKRHG